MQAVDAVKSELLLLRTDQRRLLNCLAPLLSCLSIINSTPLFYHDSVVRRLDTLGMRQLIEVKLLKIITEQPSSWL
jgi:hypothetical protein